MTVLAPSAALTIRRDTAHHASQTSILTMGSVFRATAHLSFLHHLPHPHLPVTRVQANPASLDSRAAAVATSAAQTRQARGDSPAHGALSRFLTSEAASEIGDRLEEVSGLQDLKGRQVQLNRQL